MVGSGCRGSYFFSKHSSVSALLLDEMSAWPHLVAFYQANNIIINLLREGSVLIDPCVHDLVAGRAGIHNRFLLSTSCHRLSHLAWIVTLDDPLDITSTPCRQGMLKSPSAPRYTGGRALAFICLLYTSPSPRDGLLSRMPSSA